MKKITNIMMAVLLSYFRPYNGWQFYINADVPVWHKTVGLQMVNSWALQTGIQYYL